jgi:GrpB-like predicted nucleotidyltransferase (UPF0157 family)
MTIYPFAEGLEHRKILPYEAVYEEIFLGLRAHVCSRLRGVELVHVGSTAIPDLRGKPMLDVAAVTKRGDLREEQREFQRLGFHRRTVWVDRDDKPYVCGSVRYQGRTYNINVHICHPNDPVHTDSVAFIRILRERPDLRRKYEQAKDDAHSIDPVNPEIYNREKESAIKEILALLPRS